MNKKLLAGLMSLGLVFAPLTGELGGQAYATEASSLDQDLTKLKTAIDQEHPNNDNLWLVNKTMQDEYSALIDKARDVYNKDDKTEREVGDLLLQIEQKTSQTNEKAKANLVNLQNELSILGQLIENHKDSADTEGKQVLAEATAKRSEIISFLGELTYGNAKGEDLGKKYDELMKLREKVVEKFADTKTYDPNEGLENLKLEIENAHENMQNLRKNQNALVQDYNTLIGDKSYKDSSAEKKTAYDDAIKSLKAVGEDSYDYMGLKDLLARIITARKAISPDGLPDLKAEKPLVLPKKEDKKSEENKSKEEILKETISKAEKLVESDPYKKLTATEKKTALEKSLAEAKKIDEKITKKETISEEEIKKASDDLSLKIKAVDELIKNQKAARDKKLEELKGNITYADILKKGIFYQITSDKNKEEFDKALKAAKELVEKEKKTPADVSEKEITDANNNLFFKTYVIDRRDVDYLDKSSAEEKLKILVDTKDKLKATSPYKNAPAEDIKAYETALKKAEDLLRASNDKKTEKRLSKAYKDLYESIANFERTYSDRLRDLINDDPYFIIRHKSEANEASKKDAFDAYNALLKQGKEELAKAYPRNSEIIRIYKSLRDARREIEGDLTNQARKLLAEIYLSEVFKETDAYNNAKYSKDKYGYVVEGLREVYDEYNQLLEKAHKLEKDNKLDSTEALGLMLMLKNSREYIYGDINKDFYLVNKYNQVLTLAKEHSDYKNSVNPQAKIKVDEALKLAKEAIENPKDAKKTEIALRALDEVMRDESVKAFLAKVSKEINPSYGRDKVLEDLRKLVAGDKKLKEGGFKYTKAQKSLRDAYDLAFKKANEVLNYSLSSEDELRTAYKNLNEAVEKLDGDQFQNRMFALVDRFKKEQLQIKNLEQRKAMADKINKLGSDTSKTMDDVIALEKEFEALKNVTITTTVPQATGNGVLTTTTPTRTLKNAASIVKTGIESIGKVAVILAAAAGILFIMNKKGDNKNENNK